MGKVGVYAGSFNPFTIGHQSIVERALTLFDEVVIAVGININKTGNRPPGAPSGNPGAPSGNPGAPSPGSNLIPAGSNLTTAGSNFPPAEGNSAADDDLVAIRRVYGSEPRVRVESFSGLAVEFAKSVGAQWLIRGVRSVADFEAERNMADANRAISGIDTLLLPALPELGFVSSSMVRELQRFGHDAAQFLPK